MTRATSVVIASPTIEVMNPGFMMDSVGPPFGPVTVRSLTPSIRSPEFGLAQPSPAHVLLPAHWTWTPAGYTWVAEYWALPPSSGSRWIAPRWTEFGRGYEFFEGYWN